jgi:glyoxylase-like metal-dependent hydrolase (beta-lactamase superfamily II)
MTTPNISRRTLFASTAAALATPALLGSAAEAAGTSSSNETTMADTATKQTETKTFKIGKFTVTTIRDGKVTAENPQQTFGTDQKPEDVAAALEANLLPSDRFVNSFAPTLVDTGSELVLFDTGFGEGGREKGNGQLIAGLRALGYQPGDVSLVVLTHMHGDHIGGLMEGGKPAFQNARYAAGQVEFDFWNNPARMGSPAEGGHKGVLANVAPLAEKMTFLKEGSEVVPGIVAHEAFGHSPGHLVFRLESEGKGLIVTGDTANHYVLSLQHPDWQVRFDMDKAAAAATRRKVFDIIAAERLPFVGYHMPYPAVGYVEKSGDGYRFVPESYQLQL